MANKSVGLLTFAFGANMDGFNKAMGKAQKSLKKFSGKLKGIGKTMTTHITLPILAIGGASVKLAADMEETQDKFETVFASIKDEANSIAKEIQKSYGLSNRETKELMSSTGALLVGFGFTEKEALKLSETVTKMSVDLTSFNNIQGGAKQSSEALTKMLLGETESAKQLNIIVQQGTKEYKKRIEKMVLMRGVTELQAKALVNLEIAQEQTRQSVGNFHQTQHTFTNQLRTTKARLEDLGVEIGEKLMPIAEKLLRVVVKMLTWFTNLEEGTQDMILAMAGIAAVIGPAVFVFGSLLGVLAKIGPVLVSIGTFLAANPWLAAAAAVLVLTKVLNDNTMALTAQQKAQRDIKDAMREGVLETRNQVLELNNLWAIARDVEKSDSERKRAIDQLNKSVVAFNGNLSIENVHLRSNKEAYKDYINAIIAAAQAKGLEKRISKLTEKIMRLQEEATNKAVAASQMQQGRFISPAKFLTQEFFDTQEQLDSITEAFVRLQEKSRLATKPSLTFTKVWNRWLKTGAKAPKTLAEMRQKLADLAEVQQHVNVGGSRYRAIEKEIIKTNGQLSAAAEKLANKKKAVRKETNKLTEEEKEELKTKADLDARIKSLSGAYEDFRVSQLNPQERELDAIEKKYRPLINGVATFNKHLLETAMSTGKLHLLQNFQSMNTLLSAMQTEIDGVNKEFGEFITGNTKIDEFIKKIDELTGKTFSFSGAIKEAMIEMKGAFSQGADSFKEYGEHIIETMKGIIGALIAKGVTAAVSGALEKVGAFGPAGIVMIPVVAGLAAGLAQTAFNSLIPKFAQGGVVTGPTMGLIGEAGPEAIIPLDKLDNMMQKTVVVEGRISGGDIFLSNQRTGLTRQRTT